MTELLSHYRVVHGNLDALSSSEVAKAVFHFHTDHSDGYSSPERMVEALARYSIDHAFVADHDLISGAHAMREYAAKRNYPVTIHIGIEGTTAEGKHLGAFDIERPIACYSPLDNFVDEVRKQNGTVFVPHPNLGNFSYTNEEIIHHNSHPDPARWIDFFPIFSQPSATVKRFRSLPFLRRFLPNGNANELTRELDTAYSHLFQGSFGETDSHSERDIADVIVVYPWYLEPLEAIRQRQSAVVVKDPPTRVSPTEVIWEHIKSKRLQIDRDLGKRGITLYEAPAKVLG